LRKVRAKRLHPINDVIRRDREVKQLVSRSGLVQLLRGETQSRTIATPFLVGLEAPYRCFRAAEYSCVSRRPNSI
jgi:hypothetical protein